jgi:hypothetical protein
VGELCSIIFSEEILGFLTNQGEIKYTHHHIIDATSCLLFFIHDIVVPRTASGSKTERIRYEFHLKLDLVTEPTSNSPPSPTSSTTSFTSPPASADDVEGTTEKSEESPPTAINMSATPLTASVSEETSPTTTINISTITDKDASAIASGNYSMVLGFKRQEAASAKQGTAPVKVSVDGSITLSSSLHNTTDVDLTAIIAASSPTKTARSRSGLKSGVFRSFRSAGRDSGEETTASTLPSKSAANSILDHFAAVVPKLHTRFGRHAEVDEANLQHFENVILRNAPKIRLGELQSMDKISAETDFQDEGWKRSSGTLHEPVEFFTKQMSGEASWGMGFAKIDASAKRVLAWLWNVMSYQRISQHKSKYSSLLRRVVDIPNSHSQIVIVVQKFTDSLDNRVFTTMWTWREDSDGSFTLIMSDSKDNRQFRAAREAADEIIESDEAAAKAQAASMRGIYRIKPISSNVCRVSLAAQGQFGGSIPLFVANKLVKKNLSILKRLYETFERNGVLVDAELRECFLRPPSMDELAVDQREAVVRCQSLETASMNMKFVTLHSPSPFVSMSICFAPGQRVAQGLVESVLDCSPKDATAWLFDFASRERWRNSRDNGDLARLVVDETSPHDNTIATVQTMPFSLPYMEFVARQLVVRGEKTGEFIYAMLSVPRKVDYGSSARMVRGTAIDFARVVPVGDSQCKLVMHQFLDVAGYLSAFAIKSKISLTLGVVCELRACVQRDAEVDARDANDLARFIASGPQTYSEEESDVFERVEKHIGAMKEDEFTPLEAPDSKLHIGTGLKKGDVNIVGTATTIIDASVEECAAWDFGIGSRQRTTNFHNSKRGIGRIVVPINQHCIVQYTAYHLGHGLTNREGFVKMIWKKVDSDSVVVAYEPCEGIPEIPYKDRGWVTAKYTMQLKFQRLPPVGGIGQTRASLRVHTDVGGAIPASFVNLRGVSQLMHLSRMRHVFDKSSEIDGVNRARLVREIKDHSEVYSDIENDIIGVGIAKAYLFRGNGTMKSVKSPSVTVKNDIAFEEATPSIKRLAVGRSETIVRATKEEVLSYMLDNGGRCRWSDLDVERSILEKMNGHRYVGYQCKKSIDRAGLNIRGRDGVSDVVWKRLDNGSLLYVGVPTSHHLRPQSDYEIVRAKMIVSLLIKEISPGRCKIVYINQLDLGGNIPAWVNNFYMQNNLSLTYKVANFFQNLRGLEEWDEDDGRAVGEIMVVSTKAERHHDRQESRVEARLRKMFESDRGLKGAGRKYEFLQAMLARVVENKLRPAGEVRTRLCNVKAKEGTKIGAGLAQSLATSLTSAAAVDEWIGKYPALRELDHDEIWFRPMMDVVALRLLGRASWGVKLRVYTGAGLTITDMVSDANVAWLYMNTPAQASYGYALLWMLVVCIGLNVFATLMQNRRSKPKKQATEFLLALSGLKPVVDAYRVASGHEIQDGQIIDPKIELIFSKGIEMFAESIPGEFFFTML